MQDDYAKHDDMASFNYSNTKGVTRRHGAHGWCGPGVVTQYGTCAGIGHTDVAKRGRSWLGIDRRGRRSLKGVRM